MNSSLMRLDKTKPFLLQSGRGGGIQLNSLYSRNEGPPILEIEEEGEGEEEEGEKKGGRVLLTSHKPPGSMVYQLFPYLREGFTKKLAHQCTDITHSIRQMCNLTQLVVPLEKQSNRINLILSTLSRRVVLELLVVDSKGEKMREILSRLEELYLFANGQPIRGCKSNLKMMDDTYRLVEETARVTRQPEKDELYIALSGTKRRGRRPHSEIEKKPNRVDAIKSDFILSRKSTPPVVYDESDGQYYVDMERVSSNTSSSSSSITVGGGGGGNIQYQVDHYPVFQNILSIFSACIPTQQNHGTYLVRLRHALKVLSYGEWPLKGLIEALLNCEAILRCRELVIDSSPTPYYCAYTGERLKEGDKVWHLIILVNSGERYEKWTKRDIRPASPNTSPEYTSSLKVFFLKTSVYSRSSLFYSPLDPEKPSPSPTIRPPRNGLVESVPYILPYNRKVSVNTLWYSLTLMRSTVARFGLETSEYLYFSDPMGGRRKFADLMNESRELVRLFSHCNDEPLLSLRILIFCTTIPWSGETSLNDPGVSHYIDIVLDTLLDFIELLFPYSSICRKDPLPLPIERKVLVFRALGLPFSGQKNSPQETIQTICPSLEKFSSLGKLLELCEIRRLKRDSPEMEEEESRERIGRLELLMMKHPTLFLSFFYNIFKLQHDATQPPPPFTTVLSFLSKLGIFLNTSFL